MDDTSPDITAKIKAMFLAKSPIERLKMGLSMHAMSKHLVTLAIYRNNPGCSLATLKQQLFLKFYGDDFDPAMRQRILDHFGKLN